MNLKNLLMVTAVLSAIFGLLFLIVPAATMYLYGVTLDKTADCLEST